MFLIILIDNTLYYSRLYIVQTISLTFHLYNNCWRINKDIHVTW